MTEFRLYEALLEAYETSTQNNNQFLKALNLISWDKNFQADGEHYFVRGGFVVTTPSLDPFDMDWKPSIIFSDGSYIEF